MYCNNITPMVSGHWKICCPRAKHYVARGTHDAARGPPSYALRLYGIISQGKHPLSPLTFLHLRYLLRRTTNFWGITPSLPPSLLGPWTPCLGRSFLPKSKLKRERCFVHGLACGQVQVRFHTQRVSALRSSPLPLGSTILVFFRFGEP